MSEIPYRAPYILWERNYDGGGNCWSAKEFPNLDEVERYVAEGETHSTVFVTHGPCWPPRPPKVEEVEG